MSTHEENMIRNLRRLLSAWADRLPPTGEIRNQLLACHTELSAVVHDAGASHLLGVELYSMNWQYDVFADRDDSRSRVRHRSSYPIPTVGEFVRVHQDVDGSAHQCAIGRVLECDSLGWASVQLQDGEVIENLMTVSRLHGVAGDTFYEVVVDGQDWSTQEQSTIAIWKASESRPQKHGSPEAVVSRAP